MISEIYRMTVRLNIIYHVNRQLHIRVVRISQFLPEICHCSLSNWSCLINIYFGHIPLLITIPNFLLLLDGDLITISDSSDLSFAKQYSKRALKVTLFGKHKLYNIHTTALDLDFHHEMRYNTVI